jgi:type I restriction enzyme S subunit
VNIGNLPSQWKVTRLGDVARIVSGGTPDRSKLEYWNGNIPWVKTGEINYGVITETEEKITQEGLDNSSARIMPVGTILMAMYGQGITRGRVAILGIDSAINQACAAISINNDISTDFLFYFLTFSYDKIRSLGHGANQKNLNSAFIRSIEVILPPLPEQRAIAHSLRTIQKAKEARQRELELEREHKAALMQCLFTHGTRNEPRKKTELGDIPESWQVVRLDSIAKMVSGGTPSKNRSDWWKGKIPWVSTKDLKQPRLWDTQDHISEEGLQNGSRLVPAKTLFVAVRGMCLAKDIPVAMAEVPMAFNQDIKALMPLSNVDAEYLLYTFQYHKADILQFVGTSAHGTKRLGTSSLQVLPILLPPIEEQQLISSALRGCDRKIIALEQEMALLNELFRAMLEELMTGRLPALPLIA